MQIKNHYLHWFIALLLFWNATERTMDEKIADVWQQIQQARSSKSENPGSLNPAATEKQIQKLAKALGREIPNPLRESLLVHNGSDKASLETVDREDMWQGFKPLGVDAINKHWQADRKSQQEAATEGDPFPKKPEWIPIFIEPTESEQQIYLDPANGTILLFNLPAGRGDQIEDFRYPDYLTFLKVLEHHVRNDLWFEWGNGLDAKKVVPPLSLNEAGIKQLESESKGSVKIKFPDGRVFTVAADKENLLVNSILDAMKPVKFVRTPAVEDPDHEIEFRIGEVDYKIGIKKGPKEMLSYSINTETTQHAGGDPEKLEKIMTAIIPR